MNTEHKRPKLGDIIEIKTNKGLSYFQYTHKIKSYGALIRIFKSTYNYRPKDFISVINDDIQFSTFFPLGAACNRKIIEIVANENIREELKKLPLFKQPGFIDKSGNIQNWFLWDGNKTWRIEKLTDEFIALPRLEVINDTLLIERIENAWEQSNLKG